MRVLLILLLLLSAAEAAELRLLIPSDPGGNYDLAGRIMARHLPRFISGTPVIVPQNMPGAGGLIVANHLYNLAAPDGATLGLIQGTTVQEQALGNPGARFDAAKFGWIGSPTAASGVIVAWHTTGIKSLQELRRRPTLIGASNVRHVAYAKLMNQHLGTKLHVVKGYKSAAEIVLAMSRGEIEACNIFTWEEWKAVHPEWVREGKIVPIIKTMSLAPIAPEFAFLALGDAMGRPLALPLGARPDQINELRAAFHDMVKDPDFAIDAQKIGLDISPVGGEKLLEAARGILAAPKEVTDAITSAIRD